jgi:carboxypeptidase Q
MKYLFITVLLLALSLQGLAEKDYTDFVKSLKDKIGQAPFKGSAYNRLGYLVDTYGPRMWGSVALEQAIYDLASQANKVGFENLRLEEVKNFTKWVRGNESLTLYSPRPVPQKLGLIGLGSSISG